MNGKNLSKFSKNEYLCRLTLLVLMLCLILFKNKIKLIYSATSASLGNKGKDKNLSPYAFSKSINLEQLENFKSILNLNMRLYIFTMFMGLINTRYYVNSNRYF